MSYRMVADRSTALKARKLAEVAVNTKVDRFTGLEKSGDDKARDRLRVIAINHVINNQEAFTPIIVRHEEHKVRHEQADSDLVSKDDVF